MWFPPIYIFFNGFLWRKLLIWSMRIFWNRKRLFWSCIHYGVILDIKNFIKFFLYCWREEPLDLFIMAFLTIIWKEINGEDNDLFVELNLYNFFRHLRNWSVFCCIILIKHVVEKLLYPIYELAIFISLFRKI